MSHEMPHDHASKTADLLADFTAELLLMRNEDLAELRPTSRAIFALAAIEYERSLLGTRWEEPGAQEIALRLAAEFRGLFDNAQASLQNQ